LRSRKPKRALKNGSGKKNLGGGWLKSRPGTGWFCSGWPRGCKSEPVPGGGCHETGWEKKTLTKTVQPRAKMSPKTGKCGLRGGPWKSLKGEMGEKNQWGVHFYNKQTGWSPRRENTSPFGFGGSLGQKVGDTNARTQPGRPEALKRGLSC